jgi:NAD(P)-dependent dehydrogenase (short-subunit alcohol dehydrogenase family)
VELAPNQKENHMSKLNGKIAVVTGGSTGIGLATAQRFVAEGAYVFITGRRQQELDAAVALIGNNIEGVQGDISSLADIERLRAHIESTKGHLDILFANAGIGSFTPLGQITEEAFDKLADINFKGTFFTVQTLLPLIPDGGSIILNSSIAASKGFGSFSVYSATKAAITALARAWTVDLQERRIRVNSLSPGTIDTPIGQASGLTQEQYEGFLASNAPKTPAGRNGTSEDIASAALFLASGESSFVTGTELIVDGGVSVL